MPGYCAFVPAMGRWGHGDGDGDGDGDGNGNGEGVGQDGRREAQLRRRQTLACNCELMLLLLSAPLSGYCSYTASASVAAAMLLMTRPSHRLGNSQYKLWHCLTLTPTSTPTPTPTPTPLGASAITRTPKLLCTLAISIATLGWL
ncbi:hypothetical protein ACLKA6_011595 [Drosophila palustris]